jgi:hypothetical protein
MDTIGRALASVRAQLAECEITATTEGGAHAPPIGANSVDLRQVRWAEFGDLDPLTHTVHINFNQLMFVWYDRRYKNVKQFIQICVMHCQRLTVHLPDSNHIYWEGFDSNNHHHWHYLVEFYMETKALDNLRIVEFIRDEEVILVYVQGMPP